MRIFFSSFNLKRINSYSIKGLFNILYLEISFKRFNSFVIEHLKIKSLILANFKEDSENSSLKMALCIEKIISVVVIIKT